MGEDGLWIIFGMIFLALMTYDLLITDRNSHRVESRKALRNVIVFVAVAL
jgi:hypothetical protein